MADDDTIALTTEELIKLRLDDYWQARRAVDAAKFVEEQARTKIHWLLSSAPWQVRVSRIALIHTLQLSALTDREYQHYIHAKKILARAFDLERTQDLFSPEEKDGE